MGPARVTRRQVCLVVLVIAVSGAPTLAQDRLGALKGTVVAEGSGLPIPGALVALEAGRRSLADEDGRFSLREVLEGPHRVAAIAPGCHVGIAVVEIEGESEILLTISLSDEAEARLRKWTLGSRSLGATVKTITGEEIRRRDFRTVQDAIRLVAPDMVGEESAEAGARQRLRNRGAPTVSSPVAPLVVVDGVRILQRPLDALAALNPADIERIEVARGATGGWSYGMQGVNGVIRITTVTSHSAYSAATPPEDCRFTFPR
jgi:hypothetical protein